MKRPKRRVRVEELAVGELAISTENANYLFNVLRLQDGDVVELFDGSGHFANGRLNAKEHRFLVDSVETHTRVGRPIELFQSMPKGDRWEWIIEKSSELGVERLIPLVTEHSVVRIPPDRLTSKMERWQKIASAAARQSTSTFTTEISAPLTFDEALNRREGLVLFGDFEGVPLHDVSEDLRLESSEAPCQIFVGPEGGFSGIEIDRLREVGVGIGLGPRVLRAETAAIALVVLAQSILGDWS